MRIIRAIYITSLIFVLFFSVTSSFLGVINARNSELESSQKDGNSEKSVPPIIYQKESFDEDFNGIQDSLEGIIAKGGAVVPVVVTLLNPVLNRDLEWFEMLGGRVTYVYRYVTYGFAGVISAANLSRYAMMERENLSIIEYDAPLWYHLDFSVPLIRARPIVWNTYGFMGSPDQSIAILDTGIDGSHPDLGPFGNLNFSRKMVGWYDATSDGALTPQDYGEHGTHVAGIATGKGTANSLQGSESIETTFTYTFPTAGYGYDDYLDVMTPGVIRLDCRWSGTNIVLLRLYNPAGVKVAETSGTSKPLLINYDTSGTSYPTGRYRVLVGNLVGASGNPFSVIETYPYQGRNDGYNLFTGVAPNSKLVGVKIFNNAGSGTTSTIIAGMDWVIQNRLEYRIIVASMSIGLKNGGTDTTLDEKADTLVQNGIVTTVSAGNNFLEGYTIGSPGTAAYVITVAATNDQNGITSYSSNGNPLKNEFGLTKPDVAAPGGTFQPLYGNRILSTDSNDVDAEYSGYADRNADDYQQMAGTSMSAPHVAGLAASIIQSFGSWSWTQEEALKVKMMISMTSFETQSGESGNLPPLNRGDKDSVEGYGRISADAAIEAATMTYNIGEPATATLGSSSSDKKVWARQVSLSAKTKYGFQLSVPSGSDYDLYLYNGNPDAYGQPIIIRKSVNGSLGTTEAIEYTPEVSDDYYLVVKWVSGDGTSSLQSTGELVHDVTVVYVEHSASLVYAGTTVEITVTVRNEGGATETFDVTAHYNDTAIGTQAVLDLGVGAEENLTFSWNTVDATLYVNYEIKAEASVVQNETDVFDNIYVDGTIKVKMPGDIDGDKDVDVLDLSLIARALGTDPTWPHGTDWDQWNEDCDINGDRRVDIFDLSIAAQNYGWSA